MVEKSGSHFYLKVTYFASKSSGNIRRCRKGHSKRCEKKELSTVEGKSENIFY